MKKILILIVTLVATLYSYAQVNCGTTDMDSVTVVNLPWYGKNDWLSNYTDSVEAPFNCTNCRIGDGPTKTLYQIPLNVVVFEKLGAKEMKEQLKIPSISNGTYYISVTNMNGTVSEELIIYSGQ